MEERILAVDYGRRRVGLAISDPTGTLATGIETIVINGRRDAVEQISGMRTKWEFGRVIVGLPIEASGKRGAMAEEVLKFVEQLRATCAVPVETIDERFTSVEATRLFHESGRHIKGRKGEIDRLAAELILNQYLDRRQAKRISDRGENREGDGRE